ncbi:MAG: hypothetical protein AAFQ67_08925 [Pseudomonadota bacterium]
MEKTTIATVIFCFSLAGCAELEEMRKSIESSAQSAFQSSPKSGSLSSDDGAAALEFTSRGEFISLQYSSMTTIKRLSLKAEDADTYLAGMDKWMEWNQVAKEQNLRGIEKDIFNVSNNVVDLGGGAITGGVPANFPISMVFKVDVKGRSDLIVKGRGAYDFYPENVVVAWADLLRRRNQASDKSSVLK